MVIDVSFLPSPTLQKDKVFIVIDVLRATSALVLMFDKGVDFVIPVETIEEAFQINQEFDPPLLLAGERGGLPIPGFQLNTCLLEIERENLKGAGIILTTTNGTKALKSLEGASLVVTGSLLNASSCAIYSFEEANKRATDIVLVCAGHNGDFALCDAYCAGYIIKEILSLGKFELSDSALAALSLTRSFSDPLQAFKESWSGKLLTRLGHEDDLHYCSQINVSSTIISSQGKLLKRLNKYGF
ncbi:MAG: 2-phosphosulfolactate phosphatase [Caldiserica bacterium]|jgi:2-phosphosulfolactate phosphatase|nr:2-phosphosulfolactate phosphatase [Caldisericota bacterium]MDH7562710.1 2-phosphosulfolactate phosphatase [Caldisericota bacterium]